MQLLLICKLEEMEEVLLLKLHISRETEQHQQSVQFLGEQRFVLIKANYASAIVLYVTSVYQSFLFSF